MCRKVALILLAFSAITYADPDCTNVPPQGFLPDPDCTVFWQCVNGAPIRKVCPPGLWFNLDQGICDDPENSGCIPRSTKSPIHTRGTKTTSSHRTGTTAASRPTTPIITTPSTTKFAPTFSSTTTTTKAPTTTSARTTNAPTTKATSTTSKSPATTKASTTSSTTTTTKAPITSTKAPITMTKGPVTTKASTTSPTSTTTKAPIISTKAPITTNTPATTRTSTTSPTTITTQTPITSTQAPKTSPPTPATSVTTKAPPTRTTPKPTSTTSRLTTRDPDDFSYLCQGSNQKKIPYPYDCHKYIHCVHGEARIMQCHADHVWSNSNHGGCVKPSKSDCVATKRPRTW